MLLTSSYRMVRAAKGRSWLIDPSWKIYECGTDHTHCWDKYPEVFGDFQRGDEAGLVQEGWIRCGYIDNIIFFDVKDLSRSVFQKVQDFIVSAVPLENLSVEILNGGRIMSFDYSDFRWFESVADMRKFGRS